MPEQEPPLGPEIPLGEEREKEEPSYTVGDVVEAMIVAKWPRLRSSDPELVTRRTRLVQEARGLLDRYKIGTTPDFEYLAEAIDFAWEEGAQPELVGLPSEEVAKRRAQLEASRAQREAEFVKMAYERLVERKRLHGG